VETLDLVVIAGYLLLTLGVGFALAQRASTAEDYFLGARQLPAWAVMLSVVATETSALTVISVPGIAARGDFGFLQLAFGYLLGRIAVAVWLLPGYFSGSQQTAYERLQRRFGVGTRRALSVVFLITRLLADGVRLFAGAIPLALVTGWDAGWAILALGALTLLYTAFGGLRAVVWTDVLQLAVFLAGGVAVLWVALPMAGGAAEAFARAAEAGKLQLIHLEPGAPYSLLAGLAGGALLSAASHGTDHIIVQRLLATRSLSQARRALVGSGVFVIAQFALFLAVGTALWAAGHAPAGLLPRFVLEQLPAGLAGLVIAGVLAAAMSTVSSSISALASSMTHDLYATWRPQADGAALLRAGRAFAWLWGVLLTATALGFLVLAGGRDTPVVVLALSVASATYGALLGAVLLSGPAGRLTERLAGRAVAGRHVIAGAAVSVLAMLALVALTRLSFLWAVPAGTLLCVGVAWATALLQRR
jgi:SSS family solute:Na+ symporter